MQKKKLVEEIIIVRTNIYTYCSRGDKLKRKQRSRKNRSAYKKQQILLLPYKHTNIYKKRTSNNLVFSYKMQFKHKRKFLGKENHKILQEETKIYSGICRHEYVEIDLFIFSFLSLVLLRCRLHSIPICRVTPFVKTNICFSNC